MIDAFRPDGQMVEKTVVLAHEKGRTRQGAVEAGKRLMAEKADWLGPETLPEVAIYSAMEWLPEAGDENFGAQREVPDSR